MTELTSEEVMEVSGGVLRFLVAYGAAKALDQYFEFYGNPSAFFTDTDATLTYGNTFGMY